MKWRVCEYCGREYDQDVFGVDRLGKKRYGDYGTIYCSIKCYQAANALEEEEEARFQAEDDAYHAKLFPDPTFTCSRCGKTFSGEEWLKEGTPMGICWACSIQKEKEEKAEAEKKAREEKEKRDAQERKEKAEHDAMLAKCVLIDGVYYSPDKTTIIEVDKMVRRLVVPEGVLEIGANACFNCTQLKSVKLSEGLEEIEESAFVNCTALTDITFPSTLKKIGNTAFQRTGLISVELLDGMEIGNAAFAYNNSLESVTIPAHLKKLDKYTFAKCPSLKKVTFAEEGPLTCNGMFQECTSLKEISLPEGIIELPEWMFLGCSSLSSIHIPKSLKKIGERTFKNCSSLKDISHILNQVEELGGGAFQNTGVTEITISANIKKLNDYDELINESKYTKGVFADCEKLQSVIISEGKTVLGCALFAGCSKLETVTLPSTLKSIGWGTFKGCTSLQNVVIPDNVTEIRGSAFLKCSKLPAVTIPDRVSEIGTYAFKECSSIKTLTIPSGVTTLEKGIVENCSSLETLIIPSSITQITDNPFKKCNALRVVAVEGTTLISSEVTKKLSEYAEKNFGKDKVKIKTGVATTIAKNFGSNLSSVLGNTAKMIKENEDLKKAGKQIKDDFKKAFGGLFGKK